MPFSYFFPSIILLIILHAATVISATAEESADDSTEKAMEPAIGSLKTAVLPNLPYAYNALEPVISEEIMRLHHLKHHHSYVSNYNKALEELQRSMARGDHSSVVKLHSSIKFNGGGHINHAIFWKNLAPVHEGGGEPPRDPLCSVINSHFGSLEALVQKMKTEGAAVQGSGWVWFGLDSSLKKLVVETTANQDPLVTKGSHLVPLIGIDVWEHAFYPQYKNDKAEYLKNIWKVVNWKYAADVYEKETKG